MALPCQPNTLPCSALLCPVPVAEGIICLFFWRDKLFTREGSDRRRGDGSKLKEGRFRLDLRKKFFAQRVVKHCHGLLREAVDSPSLEADKTRLGGALGLLTQWKLFMPMAGHGGRGSVTGWS